MTSTAYEPNASELFAPWEGWIDSWGSFSTRSTAGGRLPTKAPVFTYRITTQAKNEIREQLEERFGYRFATVYADAGGMAEYVKRRPEQLL